jgi:hypothetical protein
MATNTNTTLIAASQTWTSTLIVHGQGRVNVSIRVGSAVQSPAVSAASMIVTLQRMLFGEDFWRDVQEWSVVSSDGILSEENITTQPEPETCEYRIGCDADDFYDVGLVNVRLGTS